MPDIDISSDIPGLQEADDQLQRMIADEEAAAAKANSGKSAQQGQRAAQGEKKKTGEDTEEQQETTEDLADKVNENDTLAPEPGAANTADADAAAGKIAADKAAAEKAAKAEADKKAAAEKNQSRFAKEQQRRIGSWKEINQEKEALKAEKAKIDADRKALEQQRQEAEQRYTPDQYISFAKTQAEKAKNFEARAQKLEDAGKFDEAEAMREQAKEALVYKKAAEKSAEDLRKNPPADRRAAERKEWMLKAGVDFPDLVKKGSPLETRVAALFAEEPELQTHPKGIYLAARLASLESEAASVPKLKGLMAARDKEVAALKAKVQELEGLTSISGPGSAATLPAGEKTFSQMNENEQMAELTRSAEELGSIR